MNCLPSSITELELGSLPSPIYSTNVETEIQRNPFVDGGISHLRRLRKLRVSGTEISHTRKHGPPRPECLFLSPLDLPCSLTCLEQSHVSGFAPSAILDGFDESTNSHRFKDLRILKFHREPKTAPVPAPLKLDCALKTNSIICKALPPRLEELCFRCNTESSAPWNETLIRLLPSSLITLELYWGMMIPFENDDYSCLQALPPRLDRLTMTCGGSTPRKNNYYKTRPFIPLHIACLDSPCTYDQYYSMRTLAYQHDAMVRNLHISDPIPPPRAAP